MKNNILYIVVDQQRMDMLGAYNHPIVMTPNIDKLATEGIRFDSAFTPTSLCGPARTSLFTGRVPTDHGVTQNAETGHNRFVKADPSPEIPTLGDYLDGYDKIYLGKWHVAETKLPKDYGFRGHNYPGYGYPGSKLYQNLVFDQGPGENNHYHEWLEQRGCSYPAVSEAYFGDNPHLQSQELRGRLSGDPEDSLPAYLCSEAVESLQNRDSDKPFFLWLNFWGPHTPCLLPEPYYSMYDPAEIAEDPSFRESFVNKPVHQRLISQMWGVHNLSWEDWSRIIACYFGYITLIDDHIGRLLDFLDQSGLTENTTVVYTADHGDAMGAHKLIEKGEFMYDETYRIPMIIRSPENPYPGRICDEFVYLHDLFPTAIELADEKVPYLPQATSLLPLIRGGKPEQSRDAIFAQFTGHFTDLNQRMVRTRDHKLVFNGPSMGELYDLANDPGEMNNLIDNPAYGRVKINLLRKLITECFKWNDPMAEWMSRLQEVY